MNAFGITGLQYVNRFTAFYHRYIVELKTRISDQLANSEIFLSFGSMQCLRRDCGSIAIDLSAQIGQELSESSLK